jgi:NADPH-dependent 2,4-dienoyl-CoA reductase/sulfur reductase-like enzyme
MMSQVLPNLVDADMAKIIQEHLESHGVKVLLGDRLERITGNLKVKGVEYTNLSKI